MLLAEAGDVVASEWRRTFDELVGHLAGGGEGEGA